MLRAARPSFPPRASDRHVEVWWNLFAIADLAGDAGPRPRATPRSVSTSGMTTVFLSVGLLLSHVERAFYEAETDRLPDGQAPAPASTRKALGGSGGAPSRTPGGPPQRRGRRPCRKLKGFPRPDGKPIKPRNPDA